MYSGTNEMKLKINKKDKQKYPSIWKLKTIPLNNPCVKEEILRKVRKYSKQMVMKTHLNFFFFLHTVGLVFSGRFIALSTYLRKVYKSKINDLEKSKLNPNKQKGWNNSKTIKQLNKNKEDFRENLKQLQKKSSQ